jgi:hypothetical protein
VSVGWLTREFDGRRRPRCERVLVKITGGRMGEGTIGQLDTWAATISAKVCPADCAPDRSSVAMPSVSARW